MLWFPAVTERWSGSHPLRQSVSWCVGRTEGVHRWALFTCKCCQINPNGSVCVQFLYGFIAQALALGSCCLGWNCSENYPCVLCIAGPALSISQKTKASGYITGQDKQDLHPRLEAFSAGALVINNFLLATKLISEKKKKCFVFLLPQWNETLCLLPMSYSGMNEEGWDDSTIHARREEVGAPALSLFSG